MQQFQRTLSVDHKIPAWRLHPCPGRIVGRKGTSGDNVAAVQLQLFTACDARADWTDDLYRTLAYPYARGISDQRHLELRAQMLHPAVRSLHSQLAMGQRRVEVDIDRAALEPDFITGGDLDDTARLDAQPPARAQGNDGVTGGLHRLPCQQHVRSWRGTQQEPAVADTKIRRRTGRKFTEHRRLLSQHPPAHYRTGAQRRGQQTRP